MSLDDFLIQLPKNVELGKSEIYLNGELRNFEPLILVNEVAPRPNVGYAFDQAFGFEDIYRIGFSQLPLEEGNFPLVSTERFEFGLNSKPHFSHTQNRDLDGYNYEPICLEEGYLNIEVFDTTTRIAPGSFLAFFKRTARNGVRDDELDLPKRIVVQGIFHEKFAE